MHAFYSRAEELVADYLCPSGVCWSQATCTGLSTAAPQLRGGHLCSLDTRALVPGPTGPQHHHVPAPGKSTALEPHGLTPGSLLDAQTRGMHAESQDCAARAWFGPGAEPPPHPGAPRCPPVLPGLVPWQPLPRRTGRPESLSSKQAGPAPQARVLKPCAPLWPLFYPGGGETEAQRGKAMLSRRAEAEPGSPFGPRTESLPLRELGSLGLGTGGCGWGCRRCRCRWSLPATPRSSLRTCLRASVKGPRVSPYLGLRPQGAPGSLGAGCTT